METIEYFRVLLPMAVLGYGVRPKGVAGNGNTSLSGKEKWNLRRVAFSFL